MLKFDLWCVGLCVLEAGLQRPVDKLLRQDGSPDQGLVQPALCELEQAFGAEHALSKAVRWMLSEESKDRGSLHQCIEGLRSCCSSGRDLEDSEVWDQLAEVDERSDAEVQRLDGLVEDQGSPRPGLVDPRGVRRAQAPALRQTDSNPVYFVHQLQLSPVHQEFQSSPEEEATNGAEPEPEPEQEQQPRQLVGSVVSQCEPGLPSLPTQSLQASADKLVLSTRTVHLPTQTRVVSTRTYVEYVTRGTQPADPGSDRRLVNGRLVFRNSSDPAGLRTSTGTVYSHQE